MAENGIQETTPFNEIFKRIHELEEGRNENNRNIALLEQKFLLEVRGIHDILKTIAAGESFGCQKHDARITAIEKDVENKKADSNMQIGVVRTFCAGLFAYVTGVVIYIIYAMLSHIHQSPPSK